MVLGFVRGNTAEDIGREISMQVSSDTRRQNMQIMPILRQRFNHASLPISSPDFTSYPSSVPPHPQRTSPDYSSYSSAYVPAPQVPEAVAVAVVS
jgi:hypothetical protein